MADQNQPVAPGIRGSLKAIHGHLGGFCKQMESIVGIPEGAKCQEAVEPQSTIEQIEYLLDSIDYRVAELSAQLDRLVNKL